MPVRDNQQFTGDLGNNHFRNELSNNDNGVALRNNVDIQMDADSIEGTWKKHHLSSNKKDNF